MDDDQLVIWSLATFNTALVVVLLVAALYLSGPIGDLLAGLETVVGVALYCCLWATTWWTNRRWLAALDDDSDAVAVVGTGGQWGGVNGVLFFWAIFAIAVLPALGLNVDVVPVALLVLGIGSALALGIGGIVGVTFAALDAVAFHLAARLGPASDA